MLNSRVKKLTVGAVIAALYAALTLLCGVIGVGYGPIQLRISEALCVLPIFTSAAIPGLTVGCFFANFFSGNLVDVIVGTLATLVAAVLTRAARNIKTSGFPLISFLPPIVVNAAAIGVETALLYEPKEIFWQMAALNTLTVGLGQLLAVGLFGTLLYKIVKNKNIL